MKNLISFFRHVTPPPPANRHLSKILFLAFFAFIVLWRCEKSSKIIGDHQQMQQTTTNDVLPANRLLNDIKSYYGNNSGQIPTPSPCFDSTGKDNCAFVKQVDTIIDIGCGACKAHVTYDLWVCSKAVNNVLTSYVVFDNFDAEPNDDGGCDSLLLSWKNLADNGDTTTLLNTMEDFRRKARDASEWLEMEDFVTDFQTLFKCGNPNYIAVAEFYEASCGRFCIRFLPFDSYIIACGTACCKRTTQYCWDVGQQKVLKGQPNIETPSISCNGPGMYCDEGYSSIGCFVHCF